MESVRMVLTQVRSNDCCVRELGKSVAVLIESQKSFRCALGCLVCRLGEDPGPAGAFDGSCDPEAASAPSLEHRRRHS